MNIETSKGDFLRLKRLENGVKLKDVAKDTRMSVSTIYAIESGTRNLTTRIVEEIMYAIGIEDRYKKFLLYPEDILKKAYITQGEYLMLKRMDIGLNISDLAQYIGISVSMISYIESGTRRVTKDVFDRLSKPLGIDIGYSDLMKKGLNIYLVYGVDSEWGVPIIDNFYFNGDNAIKRKKKLDLSDEKSFWKVIEFQVVGYT